MKINTDIKYTLDDLRLLPQYSEVLSRSNVDVSNTLYTRDPKIEYKLKIPIISSPMDTVTGAEMAARMTINGGLGIIHRFRDLKWTETEINKAINIYTNNWTDNSPGRIGAAVGVNGDYIERAQLLVELGLDVICVDIAHGHHILMKKALEKLMNIIPTNIHIMAGNVATYEGAKFLFDLGVDSIRVGIGGGSICSTQIQTGHGAPSAYSIMQAKKAKDFWLHRDTSFLNKKSIIADGGMKNSGDILKALALGADMVMLGSLLAGTKASPGEIINDPSGRWMKAYRGAASAESQRAAGKSKIRVEGVSSTVPYSGKLETVLESLINGLQGMSYSNSRTIKELQDKAEFIVVSNAAHIEGTPHIFNRK